MTKLCCFCNNDAEIFNGPIKSVKCRICGEFYISQHVYDDLPYEQYWKRNLVKISSYLRSRTIHRKPVITIFRDEPKVTVNGPYILIDQIIEQFPKLTDRIDHALINLASMTRYVGQDLVINRNDYPILYADSSEFNSGLFMLEQLHNYGYVKGQQGGFPARIQITLKGWERIEKIETSNIDTKKCFVAMWFDPEMDEAFETMRKAITDSGYDAVRIDGTEHNGKICDEIIAQIRQSKFVVADFSGHRGGVYFEAGFALGLGIPVIWTCRADYFDDLHFDTRQYNHIKWETPEDLYQQLHNRIRATII